MPLRVIFSKGYSFIRAKTDHARAFFFALDLVLRTSMHALLFSRMIVPDAPTGQRGTMIVPDAFMPTMPLCPYEKITRRGIRA